MWCPVLGQLQLRVSLTQHQFAAFWLQVALVFSFCDKIIGPFGLEKTFEIIKFSENYCSGCETGRAVKMNLLLKDRVLLASAGLQSQPGKLILFPISAFDQFWKGGGSRTPVMICCQGPAVGMDSDGWVCGKMSYCKTHVTHIPYLLLLERHCRNGVSSYFGLESWKKVILGRKDVIVPQSWSDANWSPNTLALLSYAKDLQLHSSCPGTRPWPGCFKKRSIC